MIASYIVATDIHADVEESVVRHIVMNTLRSVLFKNKNEFGKNVYIACDASDYWRKSIFPYYKASRKKAREGSKVDWNKLFNFLNKIRDEIRDNFPYKVIWVPNTEADDIIARLCMVHGEKEEPILRSGAEEKILILSGDKDFIQLHLFGNIKQFSPMTKQFVENINPADYLIYHIMKGDKEDGVPNMLSNDDVFIKGERQTPMKKTFIGDTIINFSKGMSPAEIFRTPALLNNWERNQKLIDFNFIPTHILESIDAAIEKEDNKEVKDRSKLFKYFAGNNLKVMLEKMGDF